MSSKRKHKTLTLKDKMDILKKLDSGENMCKLAKEYGVGRATIHDLKKNKQKIVEHVKTMESGPGKRKTLRVGDCPKMENALYMWFMQERSKHTPISSGLIQSSWKKLWPTMNASSQETEEWDAEDNLPIADWLQSFSERGFEISEGDLNSWFEGTEETEQIMTDEEICEEVQEEESLVEILEPPNTTTGKIKPDTAFNCFNTCITWAEENGVFAKDIIILRNLREKVFKQSLQIAKKQTSMKDYFKTN